MFTVRIWREMRCLASSSTQLRHAGFFSSILGKVEKNDDNQKDETDKPKVEDADAKPAQEVLKYVHTYMIWYHPGWSKFGIIQP